MRAMSPETWYLNHHGPALDAVSVRVYLKIAVLPSSFPLFVKCYGYPSPANNRPGSLVALYVEIGVSSPFRVRQENDGPAPMFPEFAHLLELQVWVVAPLCGSQLSCVPRADAYKAPVLQPREGERGKPSPCNALPLPFTFRFLPSCFF